MNRVPWGNKLFYAGALSQDRERCQFAFLLEEKPDVVSGGWGGEQSGGARKGAHLRDSDANHSRSEPHNHEKALR